MRFIDISGGKQSLIVQVFPSTVAPHRVTYHEHGHFYARNSHGAYQMDTEELRTSFNRSLAIADRIRAFRSDRIRLFEGLELPLPIAAEPFIVLHLVPQSSFTTSTEFPISQLKSLAAELRPPSLEHSPYSRPNLDGYNSHGESMERKGERCRRYVQLFRNGIIEALTTRISYEKPNTSYRYWSPQSEKDILDALTGYLDIMRELSIQAPIWLLLTLCRAKEINVYHDFGNRVFDRNLIMLPERIISDSATAPLTILQPLFDQIWNAVGYDKCTRLNEASEVQRLVMDRF